MVARQGSLLRPQSKLQYLRCTFLIWPLDDNKKNMLNTLRQQGICFEYMRHFKTEKGDVLHSQDFHHIPAFSS